MWAHKVLCPQPRALRTRASPSSLPAPWLLPCFPCVQSPSLHSGANGQSHHLSLTFHALLRKKSTLSECYLCLYCWFLLEIGGVPVEISRVASTVACVGCFTSLPVLNS